MKPPTCRLCHLPHWGACTQAASRPPEKPAGLRVQAAKPRAAPAGDGVSMTSVAHPKGKGKAKLPKKLKGVVTVPAPPSLVALIEEGKRKPLGRPPRAVEHMSNENQKPWIKMKISRRTFYRKLKTETQKAKP